MPKKITVTLSEKAEKYFDELRYSLETDKGPATISQCINESLENLSDFEKETDNQLYNWLTDFRKLTGDYKKFAANPVVTEEP